jgi:methyl-accepting chemotaxis protein
MKRRPVAELEYDNVEASSNGNSVDGPGQAEIMELRFKLKELELANRELELNNRDLQKSEARARELQGLVEKLEKENRDLLASGGEVAELRARQKDLEETNELLHGTSMNIAMAISEYFTIINSLVEGDLSVRFSDETGDDLLNSLGRSMNRFVAELKSLADICEIAATGNLEVNVPINSDKDMLGKSLKKMIAQTRQREDALHTNTMNMALNLSEYFDIMRRLSEGDLRVSANESTADEMFDQLGKSTNTMVTNLRKLVNETMGAARQISTYSEQITEQASNFSLGTSQIAQAINEVAKGTFQETKSIEEVTRNTDNLATAINQIAKGAEQQARSVGEVSDAISRMAKTMEEVAREVHRLSTSSRDMETISRKGKDAVDRTKDGMEKIRDTVLDFSKRLEELGKRYSQIGDIVKVIENIANQTNLLALNAAIEAARAGEAGKGFAVVASEVRKLAERSGKATKEIADLIGNIQDGTRNVVLSMNLVTTEVHDSSKLTQNTIDAFAEILRAVDETNHQVQSISGAITQISSSSGHVATSIESVASVVEENSAATSQMSNFSQQVNREIANIASIAQENSAGAEEVSASVEEQTAAAQELLGIARALVEVDRELNRHMDKFKLQ